MITKEMIERINHLARKSKLCDLTEQEKQEQAKLRRDYIDNIKGQVIDQVENIRFAEDGSKPERKIKH